MKCSRLLSQSYSRLQSEPNFMPRQPRDPYFSMHTKVRQSKTLVPISVSKSRWKKNLLEWRASVGLGGQGEEPLLRDSQEATGLAYV